MVVVYLLWEGTRVCSEMAAARRHLLLPSAPRPQPQDHLKLRPRPRLHSLPGSCLSPTVSPQESRRLHSSGDGSGLVRDCGWRRRGGGFQGISQTWNEPRVHSLDLEVWRLLLSARRGRWRKLYWRTKTRGFFVVRDSLVSFLSCYAPPPPQNLNAHSLQSAEEFCRP